MDDIKDAHCKSEKDVVSYFKTSLDQGLTSSQVDKQLEKSGYNELAAAEGKSLLELLIAQFEDLLVRILLLAACVSFLLAFFEDENAGLAAYVEPLVILLILIANAIVGVWQESNAEKALEALKKLQPAMAHVYRDGKMTVTEARLLVPGDVVEVSVGDKVPADIRLCKLNTTTLMIEQSQLTGESQSVNKDLGALSDPKCEIQSKTNMLFASTTVSNGSCIGVVARTGMKTEIGIIQQAVQEAAEEEETTPLAQKIDDFGELLAKVIAVICIIVWVINWKHFFDPVHGSAIRGCIYYFKIAVALAVAAIPEGLPAVITTCLALGTRKMAKRHCVVRKLPSVETLGCTTVICSDKTGTLTTNEMCVVKLVLPNAAKKFVMHDVKGHTYAPVGKVQDIDSIGSKDVALHALCRVNSLCNDARLMIDDGRWTRTGLPTEAACLVLVEKLGCPDSTFKQYLQNGERDADKAMVFNQYWAKDVVKQATLEFHRDRKSMSVIVRRAGQSANELLVKGAPEILLERCTNVMLPDGSVVPMTADLKKAALAQQDDCSQQALRTLAFACKSDLGPLAQYDGPSHPQHKTMLGNPDKFVDIEQGLTFLGLVGIVDPPRPECKAAISDCHKAGIAVVMITGDNKQTAEAIALDLGIVKDVKGCSFTGREFDEMSDAQQKKVLTDTRGAVFSRTEPRHKQTIIKILKSLDEITAMTGDGVNDAPALKQADIGIAMGIAGTEVAKEAAAMVLMDDNFSSIVAAVEEGRSIYNNMKAFIRYLISSNIGEVASIFFTAALGIPEGLAPVQLLWVNLVTDGLPATALGFNPPEKDVMRRPPRRKDDQLISGWIFFRYMVVGLYVGFATVGIFIWWYCYDTMAPDQHTLVSLSDLMNWGQCSTWQGFSPTAMYGAESGCEYFTAGKAKASTLSLTVLVVIEMLNALNALSQDGSLLQTPPWVNPFLLLAMMGSIGIHMAVLYVPFMATIFGCVPLTMHDWTWVMIFSSPVIFIDEILKFFGRQLVAKENQQYKKKMD